MKRKRFSEEQIIMILQEHAAGMKVKNLVRKHGIAEQTFYRWKSKYGGNALNGAINLVDSKVPKAIPGSDLQGTAELRYGTGDNEKTAAGRITAGVGQLVFHIEGSTHSADDYNVPDNFGSDKLADSFADNSSFSFGGSWVTDKGYIGVAYTWQDSEYGLPGHSHLNGVCHTHGANLHCEAHDDYTDPFGSSDDHTAYIDLHSERADLRADYDDLLPGFKHVRLRGSYTDYIHEEIDGPSLFSRYTNKVWDGRIELTHKPVLGFTGTFGVQYTNSTFTGINDNLIQRPTSVTSIVYYFGQFEQSEYETENIGIFLNEHRSFGAVDVEFAVRQDWRTIDRPVPKFLLDPTPEAEAIIPMLVTAHGEDWFDRYAAVAYEEFPQYNVGVKHKPISASLGATWNLPDGYSTSLSLARTERAPSVRELYAYGNNLASNSYELGLMTASRASSRFPEPQPGVIETAKSINLTFRKVGGPLEFEVGLFYQDMEDYIFARLLETETETGVPHNYLMYTAADASFSGFDGQISYHLTPESHVTVFGDYVHAALQGEEDNLPRIPPGRLGIRYEGSWDAFSGNLEYYYTFAQNKFASYETQTDGYSMLNATLSYKLETGNKNALNIYLRGTNLSNELAFVHTSFVKNQSPLRGRNIVLGVGYQF